MPDNAEHQDRCHFCETPATSRCRRCHKLYCDAHGDNFCDECMDPASAIPSPVVFRGSLLALVFGTVVAVWLLFNAPEIEGSSDKQTVVAPTETVAAETQESTPTAPSGTPAPSPTPEPPTPEPTPEPQVYVVESGDTLSEIAKEFGVTVEALMEYNGLTSTTLSRGQELLIPPR